MSDTNFPPEMWGALLRIEGSTARTEGKVDALAITVSGLTSRVDDSDKLIGDLRSTLDKIEGERSQMVPEFKALIVRTDDLEEWRTEHTATEKSAKSVAMWIIEKAWPVIAALAVWLAAHYFSDHPAVDLQHSKTTIESTVSAPVLNSSVSSP